MYRLSYFLDRIWNTSTCQSSLGEQINFLSTKGGCFHKTSRFKILWTCFDILSWSTDVNYFNYLRYSPLRLFVQIRHVDWEKYALEYRTTVETLISSREACCFIKSNFGNVFSQLSYKYSLSASESGCTHVENQVRKCWSMHKNFNEKTQLFTYANTSKSANESRLFSWFNWFDRSWKT